MLVVLDDGDLHQREVPFSLGTSRAIASTLNSLVFHTAFPEACSTQQPGQQQQRGLANTTLAGAGQAMSADVLPVTLGHALVS